MITELRICVSTVCFIALLAVGCIDPKDRRPGLMLWGRTSGVVKDWSLTETHREIFLETRTPYLIRHSVTIGCVVSGETLYVGAVKPEKKHWVANVKRDPDVRLQIGEWIYERRLSPVVDEAERAAVLRAYLEKYRDVLPPQIPEMSYFRVVERTL